MSLDVADLNKVFESEPVGLTLYLGDTAMFQCHIDGAPEPHVTWFKDGQEIFAADDPNIMLHLGGVLEITRVRFSDFGRYSCKAENVERGRSSDTVQLKQNADVCKCPIPKSLHCSLIFS